MITNKTQFISIQDSQAITLACNIITRGGLVVFPTDTLYGLAATPYNSIAIQTIYGAKNRSLDKAVPILIGSFSQLPRLIETLEARVLTLASAFWPGALTLVLNKSQSLPKEISQNSTVGIRMPNHPFALALLQYCGPLAVTSANIADAANPKNGQEVLEQLDGRVDLIIDGGTVTGEIASTVVDCTQDKLVILRQGPISLETLNKHWRMQSDHN